MTVNFITSVRPFLCMSVNMEQLRSHFFIFVVPCIMLYSGEIQQDATIAFFIRNGFTLHVSGDSLTHHQEYSALYGHR